MMPDLVRTGWLRDCKSGELKPQYVEKWPEYTSEIGVPHITLMGWMNLTEWITTMVPNHVPYYCERQDDCIMVVVPKETTMSDLPQTGAGYDWLPWDTPEKFC